MTFVAVESAWVGGWSIIASTYQVTFVAVYYKTLVFHFLGVVFVSAFGGSTKVRIR